MNAQKPDWKTEHMQRWLAACEEIGMSASICWREGNPTVEDIEEVEAIAKQMRHLVEDN